MARNDRVVRVLRVARMLGEAKRGLPLKTLSERCEWPLRNLYRDIETLEAAGFPILRDEGRFRLAPGWMNEEALLQPEERLALYFARQLGSGISQTTMGRALETLWQKLSGARPEQLKLFPNKDQDGSIGLRSPLAVDYGEHRRTIQTLETAVVEQRAISCHYEALSTGELTKRVVEPGMLHWDAGLESLYFIGWCRLREAVRVFAVHRFRLATLTAERTRARVECSSRNALRNAFRVWRGGNVHRIVVRLKGWAAADALERRVHSSQQVTRLPRREARVELEVAGFEEVSRWILGYGSLAVVESPPELVAAIASELDRAVDGYEDRLTIPDNDSVQAEQRRK